METKKVIEFEQVDTLDKNTTTKKVEIRSIWWTKVNGDIISGSSSFDKEEAKAFYDKVVELKGEVKSNTILETHEIGMMSDEEAEHLYNGAEDAMIEASKRKDE